MRVVRGDEDVCVDETNPGSVDGNAVEAGLVDVEYDCSGASGVWELVGGLG